MEALGALYRVTPQTAAAQVARPDAAVAIWRVRPTIGGQEATHATLATVLEEAHQALRTQRNNAAHTAPLARKDYNELHDLIFQGGRLGFGVLNILVLAWRD